MLVLQKKKKEHYMSLFRPAFLCQPLRWPHAWLDSSQSTVPVFLDSFLKSEEMRFWCFSKNWLTGLHWVLLTGAHIQKESILPFTEAQFPAIFDSRRSWALWRVVSWSVLCFLLYRNLVWTNGWSLWSSRSWILIVDVQWLVRFPSHL